MHPCETDPEVWFSMKAEDVQAAKDACSFCPVREECAEMGRNEEFGIWGGLTPAELRAAARFRVVLLEELTNARIRRMHGQGLSISEMSRQLGLPRKTLADRLKRLLNLAA
ncbi:WhiB family transcriptional regulator [Streptomyces sp. NPDC004435]|uniref:WhiB family transcriptional regulator n=1 Tax=Streptomyces sp. NPDC004435 TaxID=3364701 RepID=UPI0036CA8A4A